jgi:hypothetical protein
MTRASNARSGSTLTDRQPSTDGTHSTDSRRVSTLTVHASEDVLKIIGLCVECTCVFGKSLFRHGFVILILIITVFVLHTTRDVTEAASYIVADILKYILIGIDYAVNGIIHAVNWVIKVVEYIAFDSFSFSVGEINLVDSAGVVLRALRVFDVCNSIETMEWEVFHILKMHTHRLCAVTRYMYPVPLVYPAMEGTFGFAIYDPNPTRNHGGCREPEYYTFCFIANIYLLVMYFTIVYVLFLALSAYLPLIRFLFMDVFVPFIETCLHSVRERVSLFVHKYFFRKDRFQYELENLVR